MGRSVVSGINFSDLEWKPLEDAFPGLDVPPGALTKILSQDSETGALTALVKLPPGWTPKHEEVHSTTQEDILLEGDIRFGEGREWHAPAYFCWPPGVVHGPSCTRNGCTLIVTQAGAFDISYQD